MCVCIPCTRTFRKTYRSVYFLKRFEIRSTLFEVGTLDNPKHHPTRVWSGRRSKSLSTVIFRKPRSGETLHRSPFPLTEWIPVGSAIRAHRLLNKYSIDISILRVESYWDFLVISGSRGVLRPTSEKRLTGPGGRDGFGRRKIRRGHYKIQKELLEYEVRDRVSVEGSLWLNSLLSYTGLFLRRRKGRIRDSYGGLFRFLILYPLLL